MKGIFINVEINYFIMALKTSKFNKNNLIKCYKTNKKSQLKILKEWKNTSNELINIF